MHSAYWHLTQVTFPNHINHAEDNILNLLLKPHTIINTTNNHTNSTTTDNPYTSSNQSPFKEHGLTSMASTKARHRSNEIKRI